MIWKNDRIKDKTYSVASNGFTSYKVTEFVNGARRTSLTLSSESEKITFEDRLRKGGWYECVRT